METRDVEPVRAIEVTQLTKTFRRRARTLDRISLTVERREMVALIGASGSGKSTLLRHIAGLVSGDRDGGRIAVEVVFGIVPQVLPLWISYALYRFESNVRAATVLGIVGAGGIGMVLWEYIRGFYYAETAAVLIIIVIAVTLIAMASQALRRMLV